MRSEEKHSECPRSAIRVISVFIFFFMSFPSPHIGHKRPFPSTLPASESSSILVSREILSLQESLVIERSKVTSLTAQLDRLNQQSIHREESLKSQNLLLASKLEESRCKKISNKENEIDV